MIDLIFEPSKVRKKTGTAVGLFRNLMFFVKTVYFAKASIRLSSAFSALPSASLSRVTNFEPIIAPAALFRAAFSVWALLMPKPIIRGLRRFIALILRKYSCFCSSKLFCVPVIDADEALDKLFDALKR